MRAPMLTTDAAAWHSMLSIESRQFRPEATVAASAPHACAAATAARSQAFISALEQSDAFDVRGVREHVDHAGRREAQAFGVHEDASVARERRRIARDVEQPPGPFRRQVLDHFDSAFA